MLISKIIFNVIAFILFIIIFYKMIKRNDTNYLVILCMQALGIAIDFIEIIFVLKYGIIINVIMYILAIIFPAIVIILEKYKVNFSEIMYILFSYIATLFKNNKQAKKFLIDLVTKYPESYFGHKRLAQIYEKEGGMRKAIDEYVQAIDNNKKDYDTYYKISYLLNELGKPNEASQMLETLLKKKPEYFKATQLLADIYCDQERYKEAANIYNDAIKYNPTSYELYYNLGMVYTMLNDFQNAKNCYEKAAAINTLEYNSYYNLAQINLIYNDLEEAEKYFQKCIDSEEMEPKAYFYLAKICMLKQDKENAIKYVNVAIETDSSYYQKAEEEPLFIPIKAYLNYPVEETKIKETKLSKKELKAIEHLENTTKLVGKININNLKSQIKKDKQINIEKERD